MIHHVEILTTGNNVFLPIEFYIDIVLVQQGVHVSDLLEDFLDLRFFFMAKYGITSRKDSSME